MTPSELSAATGMPLSLAGVWTPALLLAMQAFDISSPVRQAAFIGQCAHESMNFRRMEENLNYSAHRLVEVWPKRFFSTNAAEEYASNPEKLANFVYANRMGNGNEISGDGYRFRGRGPLMLTGRENYSDASTAILKTDRLVEFPDHVALDPYVGAAVAAWFWQARGCNELADQGDLDGLSRRINGGTIGLEDRIAKINRAREAFA